ncbi:zinc finger containing protein [Pseudozyma hubeiensis SY62]|uniref:Zinc finger containing protein n=1 Tax=Pseudozyma hubeiensis (strain SY62) TaxID=1305764 RepID=R9P5U9_PSEHS|nr:zinc finger containing protein [Pseudozyma hubeiensis SY62]GAC93475.1 zinc finger containing protein [Pseudozyma hubeiensis SY62]
MLCSQPESALAHTSLKRVNEESNSILQAAATISNPQQTADHPSPFWFSSLPSSSTTSNELSTPKTGSQLDLDLVQAHSGIDFFQLGLSSLDANCPLSSSPLSATTTSGICVDQSSPAMSTGSSYNFSTPSLHQLPTLPGSLATSSPNVGSVGTAEANSAMASPSQHEQNWYPQSHDKKPFDGPAETSSSTFQAPYPHRSSMTTSNYQSQQPQQPYHHDLDYQAHGAHPGVSQYFQHRASISGPLMESPSYAERYESAAAAPAPPRLHGLAAWENASGSARPHTADGLFGHFGAVGPAAGSHDASADTSTVSNSAGSSSRPYTPGGHGAVIDAFYAQRRMSMPDPSAAGPGKVFSYMTSGEDGGMGTSSGATSASQGYDNHYFGGYSAGASKKRPRRRYDEIERLYPCSWPGCTKSYGTLNHLNAHVAMQKHGPKRSPSEFKDMRKAWRKQKKEDEHRRQSRQLSLNDSALRPSYSGSGYGGLPSSDSFGSTSGNASVLPIAPPPALHGSGGTLPGIPGSLAHLSRYSMSSVSTSSASSAQQSPFYLTGSSADGAHSQPTGASATPLQYSSSDGSKLGYAPSSTAAHPATSTANSQYPYFGAYVPAHRGSVQ